MERSALLKLLDSRLTRLEAMVDANMAPSVPASCGTCVTRSAMEKTLAAVAEAAGYEGEPDPVALVALIASQQQANGAARSGSVVTIEDVLTTVCEHFKVEAADVISHRRVRSIALPRKIAMYLCRARLNASYTELGVRFGGRDHTTVMSAVRNIGGRLDEPDLVATIQAIERKLGVGSTTKGTD